MWYINGRVESLPLTNMRYIKGWVVSVVLRRKARDFFHINRKVLWIFRYTFILMRADHEENWILCYKG